MIYTRPAPSSVYTAEAPWTSDHTNAQLLRYHLKQDCDLASRNQVFIDVNDSFGDVTGNPLTGEESEIAIVATNPQDKENNHE